ncbi:MAG: hypothetical protein IJD01_05805 [Clostridia bacterium]|nr:hypothetical protein [Clostridia bacterium]
MNGSSVRRLTAFVLAVALCLSVYPCALAAATPYCRGDVTGDGAVATNDARLLLSLLVTESAFGGQQRIAADVNGDGKANTTDVKLILDLVMNGTALPDIVEGTLEEVDLLPPSADDWMTPVQMVSNVHCTVKTADQSGGQQLLNATETDEGVGGSMLNPYTWPYAVYSYDSKILLPSTATIEFDLTVNCSAASVVLYFGGDLPHYDDAVWPANLKLNSFMTTNVDSVSGDMKSGTYKGTVKVSDILNSGRIDASAYVGNCLWVSGLKVYTVGYNNSGVTVRKLKVNAAYRMDGEPRYSSDPYEVVRDSLVISSETDGLDTLTGLVLYQNGSRVTDSTMSYYTDNKKLYHTQNGKRVINYADGYRLDLPYDFEPDFSLSALRSRYQSRTAVLTVSKEEESPYGNTADGWEIYLTEWLNRYVGDESFLNQNYIRYTREPVVSNTMLSGYTVMTYDMAIDWQGQIAMPYYSIAIIRKQGVYDSFYLLVLKSKAPTDGEIDRMIRSFREITPSGTPVNTQGQYERLVPASWSEETKAYYNKLVTQNTTDWGFFSASMLEAGNADYAKQEEKIASEYDRISSTIGAEYGIMPTYTHLAYGSYLNPFPLEMAETFAGGNGFNGKPVLQFTYQYTLTNNTVLNGPTPVFNVLRGDYDSHFRQLARDIKAYGKPILFRLNNEMNTDWTSYCGLVSLLDPDIFVLGWQHLYDIFEEEGVDNCIWIFNPFTPNYPQSSWGEMLCYMPGPEYVQILGLTNYEMGNGTSLASFYDMYTEVYNNAKDYFLNYPWVISEFACGSGGEKQYNWDYGTYQNTTMYRNWRAQYYWINAMFRYLNNRASYPFCQNIKGAVWFNVNDYVNIGGTDYVVNCLELDETFTYAWDAFKKGIAGR